MGTDSTRWTVIRGAAAGEPRAREEFVRIYTPVVRAYLLARWRGQPLVGEADDAIQEVFIDCFKEQGALTRVEEDRPGGFRAYLHGVTRNVALRAEERRARRQMMTGSVLEKVAADEESLARRFDREWALGLIREATRIHAERATDEATLRRVKLLQLRFGDGLPIREIAARWQEPAEQLHREYAKARREYHAVLREVLGRHVGVPGGRLDEECARLAEFL
ncbi:MAG: RNA polymerase sigma factor [Planctomycetota bacterium]